jgi:hypothetical protein
MAERLEANIEKCDEGTENKIGMQGKVGVRSIGIRVVASVY